MTENILIAGFTLVIGMMGFMWHSLNARMDRLDARMDKLESKMDKMDEKLLDIDRRLCRMEGAFSSKEFCALKDDRLPSRRAE